MQSLKCTFMTLNSVGSFLTTLANLGKIMWMVTAECFA